MIKKNNSIVSILYKTILSCLIIIFNGSQVYAACTVDDANYNIGGIGLTSSTDANGAITKAIIQNWDTTDDISTCDVSGITDMSEMFKNMTSFNQNLSTWDVSGVTNTSSMFRSADAFNQNLSTWDVSGVTNMNSMFRSADAFNQNLSTWDVSGVTNMKSMFHSASAFNNGGSGLTWNDTGMVEDMQFMFRSSGITSVSFPNTGEVTNMLGMFYNASSLNSVSLPNTGELESMYRMFMEAQRHLTSVSLPDTGAVTNMAQMFEDASSLTSVSLPQTGAVTTMRAMFSSASSLTSVSFPETGAVTDMAQMFEDASSLTSVSLPQTGAVTDMGRMFDSASSLTSVSLPNTGAVRNMVGLFNGATSFAQDIRGWNVGNVTNFGSMFSGATAMISNFGATANWNISPTAAWFSDTIAPTLSAVSIASNNSTTTLAKADDVVTLTVTSPETITEPVVTFQSGGAAITDTSVSYANTSGNTWTAAYTVNASDTPGAVTFSVAFSDTAGNAGTEVTSGSGSVVVDSTAPTMTIAAAEITDGGTSNDGTLSLTFTASEATTDFAVGDISVTNGELSNFGTTSSTVYTATFTPSSDGATTIDVASSTFTDAVGNNNTAATQFNWTYDSTAPTMTIAAAEITDGGTSNDGTLSLTFTASEATTDFAVGDISVTNGELSNFGTTSSTVYTATFTPSSDGATTIDVASSTFTDAVGNNNTAATQFNWTYDSTAPTMTIAAAEITDGGTSNDGTLSLTFTASEATTDFAVGDISVTNGELSNFGTTSSTVYTATFTPSSDGATTIDVASSTFTDAVGNNNTAATQFNWTYDSTAPTMTIAAAEITDGGTSNDGTLSLTFTASEATTDFAVGDISVTNGELSNFGTTSSTVYTATFTPSSDGATTIDVASSTFTDAVGNNNTAATQFNWTYDSTAPTMTIAAAEITDGGTSNDGTLSLTFTASEATTDFAVGDISVTNGELSNFGTTSSTVYTATFTPSSDGATTIDVASSTFTDAVGNNNTAATQFNWTYDSVVPTLTFAPENNDVGVAVDSNITLTFTEIVRNIDDSALTNTNVGELIMLKVGDASGADIDFEATIDGSVITINPTNNFSSEQNIYVAIGTTVEDASNNAIIAANATFTTADIIAPALTSVSIASNNSTITTGNVGDVVTLTIVASEAIVAPVVTFQSGGDAITDTTITYVNTTGNTWTASYTIHEDDTLGGVTYSIAFSDTAGNVGTAVTTGSGSVTLPAVSEPYFGDGGTRIESLNGSEANSVHEGAVPATITLRDANGAQLTDTSNIASVVVTIVSGEGTLSTNPTGRTITIPNSGNGTYDFEVISTSAGTVVVQASVTTTSGITHVLPSTLSILFESTTQASGGAIDITRQPSLTNISGLLSGALLDTQPVVRLLDTNGTPITDNSKDGTIVTARILSGEGGSLNANGPETEVTVTNGVATFTGLRLTGVANETYRLVFMANNYVAATSENLVFTTAEEFATVKDDVESKMAAHARTQLNDFTTNTTSIVSSARSRFMNTSGVADSSDTALNGDVSSNGSDLKGSTKRVTSTADGKATSIVDAQYQYTETKEGLKSQNASAQIIWENKLSNSLTFGRFLGTTLGDGKAVGTNNIDIEFIGAQTGAYLIANTKGGLVFDTYFAGSVIENKMGVTTSLMTANAKYYSSMLTTGASITGRTTSEED